jgi:sugar lactone lactonase YvrE
MSPVNVDAPVEVVQRVEASLGEGPCWDTERCRLIWVDITNRTIHRLDPATGRG